MANEITLTGPVGFKTFDDEGFTVNDVTAALADVDGDVTVKINSGGGAAFDGIAIHSLLKQHDGKVTTVAQGIAASAASIIFMAGDERVMADGALLMIHDASGLTMGTEADHMQAGKVLGKLSNQLAGIYARATHRGIDVERAAMREETWLDGGEAVDAGFATESTDTGAAEASAFNYEIYANAPSFLMELGKPAVGIDRLAAALPTTIRQPMKEDAMSKSPDPVAAEKVAAPEPKIFVETHTIDTLDADAVRAEATQAEAVRVKECQAVFGYSDASEATKALAFDGKSREGQIALAILAETRAKGKDHLADLAKSEAELAKANLKAEPIATVTATKPAKATTPEGWKAEFEASDELKAEFMDAAGYSAFMAAQASGRVKILTGKDAR